MVGTSGGGEGAEKTTRDGGLGGDATRGWILAAAAEVAAVVGREEAETEEWRRGGYLEGDEERAGPFCGPHRHRGLRPGTWAPDGDRTARMRPGG